MFAIQMSSLMSNVHFKMMAFGMLIKMETGTILSMVKEWLTEKKNQVMKFKIEQEPGHSLNLKKERVMVDTGSMIWMGNGNSLLMIRDTTKKVVSDIGLKTLREIIHLLSMKKRE